MPRIQSFVPSGNYKKMEDIIDELIKDGATRSEANISSIAAKLIDMGLILWEAQNKKDGNDDAGDEELSTACLADESLKEILKGIYRTELFAQTVLQLVMDPSQVVGAGSYKEIKNKIHQNADSQVQ